jgi:Aldo/keto reductase family
MPAWAVARAATIAELRGWANVTAVQVEYSLLQRSVEGELFGVARELGLAVTPWSPLASGVLTGKYTRENTSPEGSGRAWHSERLMTEATFVVLDVLRQVSDELGCTHGCGRAGLGSSTARGDVDHHRGAHRRATRSKPCLAGDDRPEEQLAKLMRRPIRGSTSRPSCSRTSCPLPASRRNHQRSRIHRIPYLTAG